MTRHLWADPSTFVQNPSEAAAVLRMLDLPRIDRYLDALSESGGIDLTALRRLSENTLVAMSGEDHLKTRRVIAPFFSRAGLTPWKPVIEEGIARALDTVSRAREPDLVRDFTNVLFLQVMPPVLGMKFGEAPEYFDAVKTVQRLTEPYLSVPTLKALNRSVEFLISACPEPEEGDPAEAPENLLGYLHCRRADLPEGLDLRYLGLGLLVGSNSATQSLAFALYGLLTGPGEVWRDAASPDWAERKTQKILGLYQSTRTLVRVAPEPIEVAGCPYRPGQTRVVDIVGANACLRSESGDDGQHMSFGSGPHKCPGTFLTEMLTETAIPALARRFPRLVLKKDLCSFVQTPMMQAPVALPCETAEGSRRLSARLCDIRDMTLARRVLSDDDGFAPPPMEHHLAALAAQSGRDLDTAIRIARNAMFFMEGPRHAALRDKLAKHLGPSSIGSWSDCLDEAIGVALSELEAMPRPDLVAGFSDRIRQLAVTAILGVSPSDPARFEEIAPRLQDVLEPWLSMRDLERVQTDFGEALSLMRLPRTGTPRRSLLEALLSDRPEGFDDEDLKAAILVFYGASFNLSHTLANVLHWILSRPPEERAGAAQADWIEGRLEEIVALCSGPKFIYRVAREETRMGDLAVKRGDTVRLAVHSLNRETQGGAGHMSFGQGLHRCVGAGLSRLAIRRAIPALFARFPHLSLVAQGQAYFDTSQTVALRSLPCSFGNGRKHSAGTERTTTP